MKMKISEPLVLIPGLICTAELFAPQWRTLGMERHVMVAEHRLDDSIAVIAERLLAHAPPRFALCGLSMGGYLAFEVMRRAPGRVSRLALLDTSAKPPTPDSNTLRMDMIKLAETGQFERVLAMMWQRLVAPVRREDAHLRDIVRRMATETGPEAFVRQQKAIMARPDSRTDFGAIHVPTLVLVGSEDILTPVAESEEIAAGITGARLVVIPGSGHLSTLEAPDTVTSALEEWLEA
ncbi:MAG: alpha/beta fold hydrolase [Bosea sp. (in: a-proteobacteria)]